jgi:hypothetical protein
MLLLLGIDLDGSAVFWGGVRWLSCLIEGWSGAMMFLGVGYRGSIPCGDLACVGQSGERICGCARTVLVQRPRRLTLFGIIDVRYDGCCDRTSANAV